MVCRAFFFSSPLQHGITGATTPTKDAVVPLHYLFAAGPLARGEFKQLTGLGDRTAQALLSRLLATGVVESDSSLGPVSFGMPLDALQFLFPDLYPEVATGQD